MGLKVSVTMKEGYSALVPAVSSMVSFFSSPHAVRSLATRVCKEVKSNLAYAISCHSQVYVVINSRCRAGKGTNRGDNADFGPNPALWTSMRVLLVTSMGP